jgi:hypothetical protein
MQAVEKQIVSNPRKTTVARCFVTRVPLWSAGRVGALYSTRAPEMAPVRAIAPLFPAEIPLARRLQRQVQVRGLSNSNVGLE